MLDYSLFEKRVAVQFNLPLRRKKLCMSLGYGMNRQKALAMCWDETVQYDIATRSERRQRRRNRK